jgi:hypothetical protein
VEIVASPEFAYGDTGDGFKVRADAGHPHPPSRVFHAHTAHGRCSVYGFVSIQTAAYDQIPPHAVVWFHLRLLEFGSPLPPLPPRLPPEEREKRRLDELQETYSGMPSTGVFTVVNCCFSAC